MKKSLFICLAALMVLAFSCKKDDNTDKGGDSGKYGIDGVTPLPEAVDLGLASGVKWASFNIGASKPEEYGDYYTWGETITYYSSLDPLVWAKRDGTSTILSYDWPYYIHTNMVNNSAKLTKYCPEDKSNYWDTTTKPNGPDCEIRLLPSDDVAHVKLGGKWRIPTLEDFKELLALETEAAKDNSDYTWEKWVFITDADGNEVIDANGNVVRGIRITRKSTGATLFLPAAGYWSNTNLSNAGSRGYYWSSSLYTADPICAWNVSFNSGNANRVDSSRYFGKPVRPVCVE